MKKIRFIILPMLLFAFTYLSFASDPPDPGGSPQADNPPIGGDAPIGGGLFILIGLGAAYGGRKIYKLGEKDLEERCGKL